MPGSMQTFRDNYNGRLTDKIWTKIPRDQPHSITVWQNGRSKVSCLGTGVSTVS